MLIRKSSKKVANQNNVLTNEDTKILYENISLKSYVVNEKPALATPRSAFSAR